MKQFTFILICLSVIASGDTWVIVSPAANKINPVTDTISLPYPLREKYHQYSGLATSNKRLYLLPQNDTFSKEWVIYSIKLDSIQLSINKTIPQDSLPYKTIHINKNGFSKSYGFQGFEAIVIKDSTVYLLVETDTANKFCYIVKGKLNESENTITLNEKCWELQRPSEKIYNAGFESLAWIESENKLLALYEFNGNASAGQIGYLIDTSFASAPELVNSVSQLFFRLTDIFYQNGEICGINLHWNGDYKRYKNNILKKEIRSKVPELGNLLANNINALKDSCYAAIVKTANFRTSQWKVERLIGMKCDDNNWEGLVRFEKGFLIISDANKTLKTTLHYLY